MAVVPVRVATAIFCFTLSSTDIDYVGVLENFFKWLSINYDSIPDTLITRNHIEYFSNLVVMGILILYLINGISVYLFFEFEDRYGTIFSMNSIEIAILNIVEYHIEVAYLYISIENLLRNKDFVSLRFSGCHPSCHTSRFFLSQKIENHNSMVTLG